MNELKVGSGVERRVRNADTVPITAGLQFYRRADGVVYQDERTGRDRRVATYRFAVDTLVRKAVRADLYEAIILALRALPVEATSDEAVERAARRLHLWSHDSMPGSPWSAWEKQPQWGRDAWLRTAREVLAAARGEL